MYPCQCSMMRFASSYGTSILMRRTTSPCSFRSIACRHTCGPSSAPPMLRPDHDVESGAFTTFRPNRCLYHPKIVAILLALLHELLDAVRTVFQVQSRLADNHHLMLTR